MEVAREVAQVAQDKRRHTDVTVYREAGSDVYYYRVQIGGRRFKRSTGKTNYKEAVAQAKVIRRELQGDGQARSTMKRPGYATLGEVLAVWEQTSEADTRKNNMSAVRKWVRSFSSADPDGVCMTKLTGEQLERYLRAWPGSPIGRKSTGAQIRAVFAPEPMRWYAKAGLVLPDMTELRAVKIAGRTYDAISDGFAIEAGQAIEVFQVRTNRLVVRPAPLQPVDQSARPSDSTQDDWLARPAESFGVRDLQEPPG